MESQPSVVTGRRRQHALLRSWSGWPLTSILIDPAQIVQVREAGRPRLARRLAGG
jgi:hypothetical protein